MIKTTIVGNLGRDPEQRAVGEQTVTSFTVAARTNRKDKEGNPLTEWVNVSIWGKRGDYWYQNLHKGSKVAVTGTLTHRMYTRKDGNPDVSLELSCDDIENCSPKPVQTDEAQAATGGFTETPEDELPFD